MIKRYSSIRDKNLANSFFKDALNGAVSYDRIAGYFSSSIIELAGENLEKLEGKIRIICNSHLQIDDVKFIKMFPKAIKDEWCEEQNPDELAKIPVRLKKLYEYLNAGKITVKVIPNEIFGLIHGKAGVITKNSGEKIAFLGSMNETKSGWSGNYELVWVDDDIEGINWVQEEFDFLWTHPAAKPLAKFVVEDIKRISERIVYYDIEEWKEQNEPAGAVIETPVYRKEFGLWEHQKYFVNLAYKAHKNQGARFVLADMVGLGKTVQLALAAQLMCFEGEKPILIIVPKTLLWQWQDELSGLLDVPSAVWDGSQWIDEYKIPHPVKDDADIKKCPRRIGIISQGLIVAKSEITKELLKISYECVIVDEAHRSRRKNTGKGTENQEPKPNNLMAFLLEISAKTKSMLLATATPVQLYPIEAWDLLYVLSQNNDFVLGDKLSKWRIEKAKGLKLISGIDEIENNYEYWDWIRNPLPPKEENEKTFGILRRNLHLDDSTFVLKGDLFQQMNPQHKGIVNNIINSGFIENHNPFIRHIIRRTRDFLEQRINPETKEPFLSPIKVHLFGEDDKESIPLTTYLLDAYNFAEEFSQLLKKRIKSSGFIQTMLLRRVGSSMYAGLQTAQRILSRRTNEFMEDDDSIDVDALNEHSAFNDLTDEEVEKLKAFVKILEKHQDQDPKYELLLKLLTENYIKEKWLNRGCIVFSQYFDTVRWFAEKLAKDIPDEIIGIYAGGDKSGIYDNGIYYSKTKEEIKKMVKLRNIKLLFGTDSASEGLNLQTLGTLINLDLPWNPTRLEQRKGRIQRIGQHQKEVLIYNMRYKDSIEDRVHNLLSMRLKQITNLFGQIPDTLEDVWIEVSQHNIKEAEKKINEMPQKHPFALKYQESIDTIDWESCYKVLDNVERKKYLMEGW